MGFSIVLCETRVAQPVLVIFIKAKRVHSKKEAPPIAATAFEFSFPIQKISIISKSVIKMKPNISGSAILSICLLIESEVLYMEDCYIAVSKKKHFKK